MTESHDPAPQPAASADRPGVFEKLGKRLDERPEVQAAEEAVRRAREQLSKAEAYCRQLRHDATDELHKLREKNLGDLVEGTLACVRKHPGAGIGLAAVLGFFLGRLFHRR